MTAEIASLHCFQPAPEHLRPAPGLRDAAARRVRLPRVEHFADRANAVVVHAFWGTFEELPRRGVFSRMHFQPCVDERSDEPRPDRALVIRAVSRTEIAGVNRFVIRML